MDDLPYTDQSGSGPSSRGNAPTAAERRRNASDRFQSSRVADSMMFSDRYIQNLGASAAKIVTGNNDPGQIRRTLYNSAPGQVILDGAMALRKTGFLGQGDPIRYANNIVSGLSGGGFTGSGYDRYNRQSGFGQQVDGQGALTERVAMNYTNGLMTDLYGKGTPDSSKLNGFDATEASEIFKRIARRGGAGNAISIKQNASVNERLESARRSAVDPTLMAGLDDVRSKAASMGGEADGMNLENLKSIRESTSDNKLKKELDGIMNSTSAVFVNDAARKKLATVVTEVTKGMGALSDMYGDLSAPALMAQLESLTGQKITNQSQAKRANNMVGSMTNAAQSAGVDPKAFFDMVQAGQMGMRGRVGDALGFDERSKPAVDQISAALYAENATKAIVASKLGQQSEKYWTDSGASGFAGTSKDVLQITEDVSQGQVAFMKQNEGIISMRGARSTMSKSDAAEAAAIEAEFAATDDVRARAAIERRAQGLVGKNSRDGTYESYRKSRTGVESRRLGATGDNADKLNADVLRLRLADTDTSSVRNLLQGDAGVGAADADALAESLLGDLGASGMGRIREAATSQSLDRTGKGAAIDAILVNEAGMTAADVKSFKDSLLNADNGLRDEATYAKVALSTQTADWGMNSKFDANAVVQDTLDQMNSNKGRDRLADDKGISLSSIAKSLLNKKTRAIDTPETMGLVADAMKDAGMKLNLSQPKLGANGQPLVDGNGNPIKEDVSSQYQSGINLADGFSEDAVAKLNAAAGKDVGLAERMGYGGNAELASRTKTDKSALLRAINLAKTTGGVDLDGPINNMTAVSDAFATAVKEQDWTQRFNDLGVAQSMTPTLGKGEQTTLTQSILDGGKTNVGQMFAPDDATTYGGRRGENDHYINLGRGGRLSEFASKVANATGNDVASYQKINEDGKPLEGLEAQATFLRRMQSEGVDTVQSTDSSGKEVWEGLDAMIKNIDKAIAALRNGGAAGASVMPQMTVTNLTVENMNPPK